MFAGMRQHGLLPRASVQFAMKNSGSVGLPDYHLSDEGKTIPVWKANFLQNLDQIAH